MKDTQLQERLQSIGMSRDKAVDVTRQIRDRIHPAAVIAARALDVMQRREDAYAKNLEGFGCGLSGVNVQSTAKTANYISQGASVGSAFGPVGSAVGAVIGGAVAALKSLFGSHDVRVSAATRGQCDQMITAYLNTAAQAGNSVTLGPQMGLDMLKQVNWCLASLYGAPVYNVDPRFFSVGFEQASAFAQQLVQAAFVYAPGSIVTIGPVSGSSVDGKHSYTEPAQQVTIPNPVTISALSELLIGPMLRSCQGHGAKSPGNCPAYWAHDGFHRMLFDLVGYWINQLYPQVFAASPQAAPVVGAPIVVATPAVVRIAAAVVKQNVDAGSIDPSLIAPQVLPHPFMPSYQPSPNLPPMTRLQDGSAGLMQQQLADSGINMVSPQAQALLADVASQGVTTTPQGPSKVPFKAGFGLVATGVLLLLFLGQRKHGQ